MLTSSKTNIDNNNNEIHKDITIGSIFNSINIHEEKNNVVNFISINMLSEFNHASVEELRLADYELRDKGNITKYKINDTSSKFTRIKNIDNNDNNLFHNQDGQNVLFRHISSMQNEEGEEKQEGLFGNINNLNNNGANSLFGNINTTNNNSLFENNRIKINNPNETGGLFGNNNRNEAWGLFENKNTNEAKDLFDHKDTNTTGALFGNNNTNTMGELFDHKTTNITDGLFGNNNTNTTGGSFYDSQNRKIRSNINIPNEAIKKCEHEKDFVCYCTVNSKNEGGLLCYECLYKYHKDHIVECFLIKKNNFENYKSHYKQYINKQKINIKRQFDKIISKLYEYENELIDDISKLFEEKVNLDFDLPIKIPFIERFEIAINRKISSLMEKISFSSLVNPNWVNLFKNKLDDLKFSEKNPNFFETLKLKSSVDFNLIGN